MSTYLKIDKQAQLQRAKRRAVIRKQRERYFMVYSMPFFRGKRGYIGRPFRLTPPKGMQVIEESEGLGTEGETSKLLIMRPPDRSKYAPHQGAGEMTRRADRLNVQYV